MHSITMYVVERRVVRVDRQSQTLAIQTIVVLEQLQLRPLALEDHEHHLFSQFFAIFTKKKSSEPNNNNNNNRIHEKIKIK